MQFLPSFLSENIPGAVQALAGISKGKNAASTKGSGTLPGKTSEANSFLLSLNEELAGQGITPIVDVSISDKLPKGFRTLPRGKENGLNSEDISYITNALRKKGVHDSTLENIEDMLASGTVPTLGNLMGMIAGKERASEALTDQEAAELDSLLGKMQFSGEEKNELYAMMEQGDAHKAAQTIAKRAQVLGKEALSITKGELNALMRGLDISNDAKEKITTLFGKDASAELSGEALDRILRPALHELADKKESFERMASELKAVINDALHTKKIRDAAEPVADKRGSKLTERAETRMRDDMTAKANGFGQNPRDAAREDEETAFAREQAEQEYSAKESQNAEQRRTFADRRMASLFSTEQEKPATSQAGASSSAREGLASVFSRFDVSANVTGLTQSMTQNPSQNTASNAYAHRQEIFSQVEQGLLSKTQNGSHKITLQLDPVDLGRISLMLSVKGGEVRAVIRAENPETTAVLSEQMNQLRASLEEQGLKVAEINIETQLSEDTTRGQQWADTAEFNQEQEMREHARFMRLAKLRREAGADLAQDMQSKGIQEEISQTGLHIIA